VAAPRRVAWAPGKLVLVGEYAVLDGAGGVVAAIDRGVRCTVYDSDRLEVQAPGDDSYARAALDGAPPGRYVFEDARPVVLPGGGKAGFGGSAAAVVAGRLAAGLALERAAAVHSQVQGGGSGIDVFASVRGGVRRFPHGEEVEAPPFLAVYSGQAAATGQRVARYRAWDGRERFVDESRALVAAFAAEPLRVVTEAYALVCAMARDAGIAYDLEAFRAIARIAAEHGGAAKPSGAGGGDVAVVLAPGAEILAAIGRAVTRAGLVAIDVAVAGGAKS
jgi:phosphomevalonate kinase